MENKICTSCKKELKLSDFYSKCSRLDSSCKICKKEAARLRYQKEKNSDSRENLMKFINLMAEIERKRFNKLSSKIEKVINRCRSKQLEKLNGQFTL